MPSGESPFSYNPLYPIIFYFCMMLLAGGCSAIQELVQGVQKPVLSVTDMRVTGFDFREVEMTFDVTVDNPNAVELQMEAYDYSLAIDGKRFVSGHQNRQSRIEASGESTFRVPVTLNFKEVYSAAESLAESDEAGYSFDSSFTFDLPGLGSTEVAVQKEGEIPMLRMPVVRIASLQINEMSLSGADLSLILEFENGNGFGLLINSFDYSLNVDGSRWAEGSTLEGVSVSGNDTAQLEIPLKLDFMEIGISVYRMLSGSDSVPYELSGTFSVGADHPLLGSTELQIKRDGRVSLSGGE